MRIIIDFDPVSYNFSALFQRSAAELTAGGWPPPPPDSRQFQEIATWLNIAFETTAKEFQNDPTASGAIYTYLPETKTGSMHVMRPSGEKVIAPPPFINR